MANSLHRRDTLEVIEYRYTVVYGPAEEGGYVVTVPALPGFVTEGDTLDETRWSLPRKPPHPSPLLQPGGEGIWG